MNENRNVNDTRQNLESILYGYYIKYDKMNELYKLSFTNMPKYSIDIYVDVYDMLKPIYSRNIYANKQYTIVSSVINLAAHLRHYFKKYHRMKTNIYLVYADNSSNNHKQFCSEFGDDYSNMLDYERNNQFIITQLELVRILAAYIDGVYFIKKTTMFPIFVYDNITNNPGISAIIITKNNYAYQIPAFVPNTAIFRPRKYNAEDTSFAVYQSNILYQYYNNITKDKTLEYMNNINPQHLSLLMSLTGNTQFNLRSVISTTMAIRILYEAIISGKLLNSHTADIDYAYSIMPDLLKYISDINLRYRYNACDIIYQHLLYTIMPEALDFTWLVNFKDPATVQDINNRYFADNPLDLNSL